jgi:serine/threonine protein phosphatase PrpC
MAALTYRYVALTDTGLRRADNEDSGYASDRLLVIADGMGGAAAGEIASSETLDVIRQLDRDLDVDAIDALDRAVNDANKRLAQIIAKDPSVEGMGTTLDALLWDGEKFAFAHIGDSRVYRLRGGELQQLSTDHTFVQSLIDEGRISPAEARVHPHRSLILRAMLGRDDNGADISWVQPVLGDRYLLCSDGLSDMVEDDAIRRALGAETIDLAATDLVRLALEGGGVDNVTVVIAEFVEEGTEPDENLSSHDGRPQLVGAVVPPTGSGPAPATRPAATTAAPEPVGGTTARPTTPRSCGTRRVRRAGAGGCAGRSASSSWPRSWPARARGRTSGRRTSSTSRPTTARSRCSAASRPTSRA